MDSHHQSATKMDNCNESSLLDQDMLASSEAENNSTDQAKRRKLETNPLKISHIVEKILSFLDTKTIKNARQMDKLWSAEGAKVLITKCYVNIQKALQNDESSSSKSNKTDQFKAFLSYKSNKGSVVPNIAVDAAGDIELWKSFGVLGKQVNSLKLNLCEPGDEELLSNLSDFLPNLKDLKFSCGPRRTKFSENIHSLWKHENLKKLDITIDLQHFANADYDDENEDLPDLDSFFTGFVPWAVCMLQKIPNWSNYITSEDLEKLRTKPSILDLKELEKLTIQFWRCDASEIPEKMLAITGEHAFKLMSDTRIIIQHDGSKADVSAFKTASKLPNVTIKSTRNGAASSSPLK